MNKVALDDTRASVLLRSLPIALYMAFNPEGEIEKLTIAAVDLHPLTEAVHVAAQTGALQPP